MWEVEVHSVVSVGGVLGVALPSILCGDDGRGSCVWRWGAFVHLSGTSACLWLQHESTFGVLPCVGWVETAWRLKGKHHILQDTMQRRFAATFCTRRPSFTAHTLNTNPHTFITPPLGHSFSEVTVHLCSCDSTFSTQCASFARPSHSRWHAVFGGIPPRSYRCPV